MVLPKKIYDIAGDSFLMMRDYLKDYATLFTFLNIPLVKVPNIVFLFHGYTGGSDGNYINF